MQDFIKLCITSSQVIDHYCDLFDFYNITVSLEVRFSYNLHVSLPHFIILLTRWTWNSVVSLEVRFNITFMYHFLTLSFFMSFPSQRRGGCGHMMGGFDHHSVCARCRDKKKGSDPCCKTPPEACEHCDSLSPEQKIQLSTPSYKLKKERKDAKSTPKKDTEAHTTTLEDPGLVSVLGAVDSQDTPGDSASNEPVEKKKKSDTKHASKSTKAEKSAKSSSGRSASTSADIKASTSSADTKIADLDKKWADRFNRLEALLLAKTVDPPSDPVFSTVKVTPAHAPPANVVRSDPFIKLSTQPSQPTDPAGDSATDSSHHKSDIKPSSSAQPDPPASASVKRHLSSAFDVSHKESSSSDSDSLILRSTSPGYSTRRGRIIRRLRSQHL